MRKNMVENGLLIFSYSLFQPSTLKKVHMLSGTLDLHLFIISINSFLPIPVSRKASAALKFGMLS